MKLGILTLWTNGAGTDHSRESLEERAIDTVVTVAEAVTALNGPTAAPESSRRSRTAAPPSRRATKPRVDAPAPSSRVRLRTEREAKPRKRAPMVLDRAS